MNIVSKIAMLGILGLLVSCSSKEDEAPLVNSKQGQLFKDQVQAIEKAKGVEQMIQQGADQRQLKLEKQTQ